MFNDKSRFIKSSTPLSNSSNSLSIQNQNQSQSPSTNTKSILNKKRSIRTLKVSSSQSFTSSVTPGPPSSRAKHSNSNSNSHSTTTATSAPTTSNSSTSKLSFFKKLAVEFNLFLFRLRSISEEVFTTDELVADLFTEVDSDDQLDRLVRHSKGYNSMEETFLQEFKKFKSLDKMVEYHQQKSHNNQRIGTSNNNNTSTDVKSSTTLISDGQTKLNYTLQDFIRQSFTPEQEENVEDGDADDEDNINNGEDLLDIENIDDITYHDLDVYALKQELESQKKSIVNDASINLGLTLWEFRRNKWLQTSSENEPKIQARIESSSINHIPKDSYVKIYNNLVEKNRTLRNDKKINLGDLIKIINAGWIAEEKWERAAKGLP
ncbi:uncharacterized protein RJT21DRAFT_113695 [Scheffersomyces amazonensis]|uniref:uncharacterized protein n=1 Tax=Scheffersomyces amazonensis TaxID=1078765 RepID=UPI00315DC7F8